MAFRAVTFDETAKRRIKEASDFEKQIRHEAWLNLPVQIYGYTLRQITLRDILELEYTENKLVSDYKESLSDLVHFVVMLTDEKEKKNLTSFIKKVTTKLKSEKGFRHELLAYFNVTFNDLPSNPSSNQHTVNNVSESQVWLCSMLDTIFSEYGWTQEETLNKPACLIFQLYQRILLRHLGDKYSLKNSISQAVRADEMKKALKKEKEENA